MTKLIALHDRGLLKISGGDAVAFLNNLITNDMAVLDKERALFAALLTPQGKIIHEFFVVRATDGILLDLLKSGVADLIKKLTLYKLRADVEIEDVSSEYQVFALDDGAATFSQADFIVYQDPRSDRMGQRVIVSLGAVDEITGEFPQGSVEDYIKLRLDADIPSGGIDYELGDCFPHEAGFDLLQGIDFKKGCYVGQEVVSRMEHRGTARKRIAKISGNAPLPARGAEIRSQTSLLGVLGSVVERKGLALVRLDRVAAALERGEKIMVENVGVEVAMPQWADYTLEI